MNSFFNIDEKFKRKKIRDKYLPFLLTGFFLFMVLVFFITHYGYARDVYEFYNNSIIFYLLLSISFVILNEYRIGMISAGIFIISFAFFFDAFEELVFFEEDGLIDKIEDLFSDYIFLAAVVILFMRFIIIIRHNEKKIISLKHESLHDNLTGVYNRGALFQIYGESEITEDITFCYIDLDGFKEINDRNGHDAGDYILKEFTEIITRHKRSSDQFFRIGGDEFILVVDTIELEIVGSLVERFSSLVKKEMTEYPLEFTCGFVPVTEALTLDEVLKKADTAMYKNKQLKKRI